jgi:hypothetical protein
MSSNSHLSRVDFRSSSGEALDGSQPGRYRAARARPEPVQAGQTPVSVCVEALEQLATLHMAAPVYKLTGGQERQYLADTDLVI